MHFPNDKNFSDFLDSQVPVPCNLMGESPSNRYRSQSFAIKGRFTSLESVDSTLQQKSSSLHMKPDLMIPERVKDINEDSDSFQLFNETSFEEGLRSSESEPESDFLRETQQPAAQEESRECHQSQISEVAMPQECMDVDAKVTSKVKEPESISKDQADLKRIRQKQAEASRRYRLKKRSKLSSGAANQSASTQDSSPLIREVTNVKGKLAQMEARQ